MGAAQASKASNVINRSIVWLDASVNDTQENINAQQLLRTPMNHLKTYKDDHECEKYIQSVPKGHRIILIVGGRLGQLIVPRIHQLFQISSIFVYCMDKRNQEWTNAYKKVKGVIEELNELILQVLAAQEKQTSHDRFEQPLSINIFNTVNAGREKSTSELNGQFVHSQILIDCLLRMRSSSTDRHDFLTYCKKEYANDNSQLNFIREFEHDYAASSALTWYTRDCFLYKLLNKALRTQNIDLLYLYGFFIRDLYQQLKRNQYPAPIHLYRGQLMSKKEVQQLRNFIGQLISMNSFLSTTTDREVAIIFSGNDGVLNNDIQPVLFEIQADPDIGGIKPFADITSFSYMEDEEEVLMMLGAIFRIVHIRDESQLCIIQLVLCSENGHDVKPIFDQMKNDYHGDGNTNAGVFGIVLSNMGKFDEAEKYLLRSLDESPPEHHTEDTNAYNLSVYYVNLDIEANMKSSLLFPETIECINTIFERLEKINNKNDPFISIVSQWYDNLSSFLNVHPEFEILTIIIHINHYIARNYVMTDQYKFYLNHFRQSSLSQSIFTVKRLFYIKTCSFFLGVYLFVKGPDFFYPSEELIPHFGIDYVQTILLHTYTIESWNIILYRLLIITQNGDFLWFLRSKILLTNTLLTIVKILLCDKMRVDVYIQ
ncbi:unnamed protein product [Rotaria sordida]|uniref:ADP ribosyltransferase domain-containing protein n=1 Tax=Rotaria sordida TaxID=392033 RepID=A0A815DF40_9BILA|nr:unnamed protein product [Rotaria sordida]CAF1571524.1 unnamed protein product [Rotaria sordida]